LSATLGVEEVAEACVVAALRRMHFSIVQRHVKQPGPARIEAWMGRQRVLVQVNTTVSPAEPHPLTSAEEQSLRRWAARAGGQPWEARLFLGPDLEVLRLDWRPLELEGFAMEKPDGGRGD
jgi:hypothetical protein